MADDIEKINTFIEYQFAVRAWMLQCFSPEVSEDLMERSHRFMEEAIELGQSCGTTQEDMHKLVDYVYGRPAGDAKQEIGGVMLTLGALAHPLRASILSCAVSELARVNNPVMMQKIRDKQATKPHASPLPGVSTPT